MNFDKKTVQIKKSYKDLSWLVAGWMTQLLTLIIGTILIIASIYMVTIQLIDKHQKEIKKRDEKADESIIYFLKQNKDYFLILAKELLKIILMLVALHFEIDNFLEYTAGEALLFEPVFMVQAEGL